MTSNKQTPDRATETLNEIQWPEKAYTADLVVWEKNLAFVKLLATVGVVTQWLNGEKGKDYYLHFPYIYNVNGAIIQYLPHWTTYVINGTHFKGVESSESSLRETIAFQSRLAYGVRIEGCN